VSGVHSSRFFSGSAPRRDEATGRATGKEDGLCSEELTCQEVISDICLYVDGELQYHERVEAHLVQCHSCQSGVVVERSLRQRLRVAYEMPSPPADLIDRIRSRLF